MASKVLEDAYTLGRTTVDNLMSQAEAVMNSFNTPVDIGRSMRDEEQLVNAVSGYNAAINAILSTHIPLHNELIEHPRLMAIRRFLRSNGGM